MDIDVPLLLTDYLIARSQDMDLLEKEGIEGQINFSTGQEIGYWLFDWTVALLSNSEYAGNPHIGLELLGEDIRIWKKITDFQTEYFKKNLALTMVASTNILDEVSFLENTHERHTLGQLRKDRKKLDEEISLLEKMKKQKPEIRGVKNNELKALLDAEDLDQEGE